MLHGASWLRRLGPPSLPPRRHFDHAAPHRRRDSKWANSALVAAVQPADWAHLTPAHGPLAGMALQQQFEREAAARGGGGFAAPAQRVVDFLAGAAPRGPLPPSSYRLGVTPAPLHDFYPPHMTAAFVAALARFDRQLPGFASSSSALLHAAETRTSAPLRIDRTPEGLESVSLRGLYPCGEGERAGGACVGAALWGAPCLAPQVPCLHASASIAVRPSRPCAGAGYAGGIVSSAVDGLRVGGTIAAELTGRAGALEAGAFKVKSNY